MAVTITKQDKEQAITVAGHTFANLQALQDAVSVNVRIGRLWRGRFDVTRREPRAAVPGLQVACLYEPYPCFDSDDYATENREYCNYFFAAEPFTYEQLAAFAVMKKTANSCLVNEETPASALPAVYWGGDTHSPVLIAEEQIKTESI